MYVWLKIKRKYFVRYIVSEGLSQYVIMLENCNNSLGVSGGGGGGGGGGGAPVPAFPQNSFLLYICSLFPAFSVFVPICWQWIDSSRSGQTFFGASSASKLFAKIISMT